LATRPEALENRQVRRRLTTGAQDAILPYKLQYVQIWENKVALGETPAPPRQINDLRDTVGQAFSLPISRTGDAESRIELS
jgi:hypothetical protein